MIVRDEALLEFLLGFARNVRATASRLCVGR